MKKGSIIFIIAGIAMLLLSIFVVIPAVKQNSKECTLKVDGVVIADEEHEELVGEDWHTYYKYTVEYEVNGKIYKTTFDRKNEPAKIGTTTVSFWVNPEKPWVYTTTKNLEFVSIISIGFSVCFMMFGVVGLVIPKVIDKKH